LTQLLYQYSYLQILDFLTTVAFLLNGVGEGNPVVRWAMNHSSSPMMGLIAIKVMAVALGVYCWQRGREKLLLRINILFAGLVAWNLVSLIIKSAYSV
jgi:hypothetical protein